MPTSQIPVVKLALVEVCTASDTLADVEIIYGRPRPELQPHEFISFADVTTWDYEWANVGASRINEKFELITYISARRPAQKQQEATERCFEILAALEDILRDDFIATAGLQGIVVNIPALKPVDFTEVPLIEGEAALVEATTNFHTRI